MLPTNMHENGNCVHSYSLFSVSFAGKFVSCRLSDTSRLSNGRDIEQVANPSSVDMQCVMSAEFQWEAFWSLLARERMNWITISTLRQFDSYGQPPGQSDIYSIPFNVHVIRWHHKFIIVRCKYILPEYRCVSFADSHGICLALFPYLHSQIDAGEFIHFHTFWRFATGRVNRSGWRDKRQLRRRQIDSDARKQQTHHCHRNLMWQRLISWMKYSHFHSADFIVIIIYGIMLRSVVRCAINEYFRRHRATSAGHFRSLLL